MDFGNLTAPQQSAEGNNVYYSEEGSGELHQQLQGLVSEGQEVFVLDEETGEYQKCIYVPQPEGGEQEETTELVEEQQEVEQQEEQQEQQQSLKQEGGGEQIQLTISDPAALAALASDSGTVNLESLLASGAINAETFSALTGQSVSIVTQEEEEESVHIQVVDENEVPASQQQQQPLYVVQCPKCEQNFKQEEFEAHYSEAHGGGGSCSSEVSGEAGGGAATSDGGKSCSICKKALTRKDYLTHFKDVHSDIRLGCPKCEENYHSPDLLNVHYKLMHYNQSPTRNSNEYSQQEDGRATLKNVRLLIVCKVCQTAVEGTLDEHMETYHPEHVIRSESPPALLPLPPQLQLQPPQQRRFLPSHIVHPNPAPSPPTVTYSPRSQIHCTVCQKDYSTQREFANHRRRKDFCRPPVVESPPTKKRRVGILRKRSL